MSSNIESPKENFHYSGMYWKGEGRDKKKVKRIEGLSLAPLGI